LRDELVVLAVEVDLFEEVGDAAVRPERLDEGGAAAVALAGEGAADGGRARRAGGVAGDPYGDLAGPAVASGPDDLAAREEVRQRARIGAVDARAVDLDVETGEVGAREAAVEGGDARFEVVFGADVLGGAA